jgi:hypothetical protein
MNKVYHLYWYNNSVSTQTITTPELFRSRVDSAKRAERKKELFIDQIERSIEQTVQKLAVQQDDKEKTITIKTDVDADTFVSVCEIYRMGGWHTDATGEALVLTLPQCPEDEYDADEDDDHGN